MLRQVSVMVVGLVCVFALSAGAGEEQSVPLDKVPAHILMAAKNAAPGVKFQKAGIEVEDVITYELVGKNGDGRIVEVDVTTEGKVLEVETEVKLDEVPKAVKAAHKRRVPNVKPEFIEKSERPCGVWYEIEGMEGDKTTDVEISACGKKVIIEEDDDVDVCAE